MLTALKTMILHQMYKQNQIMSISLRGGNQFEVRNGKLVPKQSKLESAVNYRYIPYTPINKPAEQDYFRATIDELLKENTDLKIIIDQQNEKIMSSQYPNRTNTLERGQAKLYKEKYIKINEELQSQRKSVLAKDQHIRDLKTENHHLNQTIEGLGNELDMLKAKLNKSQIETHKISRVLESFNGAIEKVSQLESALSDNPELQEQLSLSPSRKHSNLVISKYQMDIDDRYMTPRQKIYDLEPSNNKNRSAQPKQKSYRLYSESPEKQNMKETAESYKIGSEERISSQNSSIEDKYGYSGKIWGGRHVMEATDPITGSLSAIFTRNRQ